MAYKRTGKPRGRPPKKSKGPSITSRTEQALREAKAYEKNTGDLVPLEQIVPDYVYVPPTVRDNAPTIRRDNMPTIRPPTVEESVIRIHENVDPLGQLIAMANGQPILTFKITKDGDIEPQYEVLPLAQRMQLLKYLDGRITPRMSMQWIKHRHEHVNGPEDIDDGWTAKVEQAAIRSTANGSVSEG